MSGAEAAPSGRLFVVAGGPEVDGVERAAIGEAIAVRSEHSVLVDGDAFAAMVVAGRAHREPDGGSLTPEQLRQLFLRWSATIATAETYLIEGFDVVITDVIDGQGVDDFLDLVAPQPVHLVMLHRGRGAASPGTEPVGRYGLWVDLAEVAPADVGDVAPRAADLVLEHLDEALVLTDEDSTS